MVDMVKLASVASIEEAHAIRGALEAHGIQVNIANEQHAQMEWYLVPALDGIALQVPESQRDRAKQIIRDIRADAESAVVDTKEDVEYFEAKRRERFNRARLVFFLIILLPAAAGIIAAIR